MYRIISSRAPRTLHVTPSGTPKLLPRVCAPASARHGPDVHPPFLGYATLFSSTQMMEPPRESQRLAQHAQPVGAHFSSHDQHSKTKLGPDPYSYTSGRWLRRDALERESRSIQFDFDALCCRVLALCTGASTIVSYDKKEGGFNRVFIFHTDNAKRIVARLPFPVAGPPRLTINSEVATIEYLQGETEIPIPKILDWSEDASNAIGSEYIIMEHAPGISLREKWPTMDVGDQIKCIKGICQKLKEITDLKFPAYGSLYFADTPSLPDSKLSLNADFCIGPHCGAMYWDCNVGQPRYYHNVKPHRGPWQDLDGYCDGLIDTGISRIPPPGHVSNRPRYQGSIETHKMLLQHGRTLLKEMAKNPLVKNAASPLMFHPDLHKRNIFVSEEDPTIVSAIIDWQSNSIEPAFWYADATPDFARPDPDPKDPDEIEPKSEACAKAYDVCMQFFCPKLSAARAMYETYFRPFRYCYRTWEDGAVAFREELIQTSRLWKELGFTEPCPFSLPSPNEIAIHQKEYKVFETAQQLRHSVSSLLNTASDGWVPSEDWEGTESAHWEIFQGILQEILHTEPDEDESIRGEDDLREIWPFDLKQ